MQASIKFGTIDCNIYGAFCSDQGVTGYPSPYFYTAKMAKEADGPRLPYKFDGNFEEPTEFVEHVNDVFSPPMRTITREVWDGPFLPDLHSTGQVWLVVFTAGPWCGPCQGMDKLMKARSTCIASADSCF